MTITNEAEKLGLPDLTATKFRELSDSQLKKQYQITYLKLFDLLHKNKRNDLLDKLKDIYLKWKLSTRYIDK